MTKENNTDKKRKILYIVFSIITSLVLWLYVAYVDNPEKDVSVSGIKVEFSGEELLADNNLVVTSVDTASLTITFSGSRNVVSNLSKDNVRAVVDLSDILNSSPTAGTHQLTYTLEYGTSSNGITVSSASKNYITVTIEKLVTETIPVRANYEGGIADGYTAEEPVASPETITVSGPRETVDKISYALATLNRENLSKSVSEQVPVVLMDEDGNVVSDDGLTLSTDTVTVSISVLMVKDVPLEVNLVYGASATAENTIRKIDPEYITISGDPEILDSFNVITLGTIDLTSFTSSYGATYTIVLPNDVTNLSGVSSASVEVRVLNTETTKVTSTNIITRNDPTNNVSIINQSIEVTLRGKQEDLDAVTPENIRIVADLSGLDNTSGRFTVNAKVYVDGFDSVDAVGEYKVTVIIS
ncbi:MAG: YbbR-like domain-containing protein [Oscillospiraceae bacterium]